MENIAKYLIAEKPSKTLGPLESASCLNLQLENYW